MNLIIFLFFIGGLYGLPFNEACEFGVYIGLPVSIIIQMIIFNIERLNKK